MVLQMAGFTVCMVMVLGGACGAAVKYMRNGKVSAKIENRMNDGMWKEAMAQSHLTEAMDMREKDVSGNEEKEAEQNKHHYKNGGMKVSHAMA